MPRRREVPKRQIRPDPKYQDRQVAKFTHVLMRSGKKSVAEAVTYGAFNLIEQQTQDEPLG
jgi:small subunit ribosomal protein S7